MLDNDDPIVQEVLGNVKQVKNGEAAIPAGSRQMAPKVTELNAELEAQIKELEKPKKLTVTLSPQHYAIIAREAVALRKGIEEHFQSVITEIMMKRLGKATISSASYMGAKVVAPSNNFGVDY